MEGRMVSLQWWSSRQFDVNLSPCCEKQPYILTINLSITRCESDGNNVVLFMTCVKETASELMLKTSLKHGTEREIPAPRPKSLPIPWVFDCGRAKISLTVVRQNYAQRVTACKSKLATAMAQTFSGREAWKLPMPTQIWSQCFAMLPMFVSCANIELIFLSERWMKNKV